MRSPVGCVEVSVHNVWSNQLAICPSPAIRQPAPLLLFSSTFDSVLHSCSKSYTHTLLFSSSIDIAYIHLTLDLLKRHRVLEAERAKVAQIIKDNTPLDGIDEPAQVETYLKNSALQQASYQKEIRRLTTDIDGKQNLYLVSASFIAASYSCF